MNPSLLKEKTASSLRARLKAQFASVQCHGSSWCRFSKANSNGCRFDSIRARKGKDADIPASVKDRVNTAGPSALNIYLLHHNVVYKGSVTAKDVTNGIVDGVHLACEIAFSSTA